MSEAPAELHEEADELVVAKGWDGSLLLRLAACARPWRAEFARSFGVLAALFALQLAGPWILRHALDGPVLQAARELESGASSTIGRHLGELCLWAGLYLAAALLQSLFSYYEVYQLGRTGQLVIHDLRARLFAHIQRLDLSFFDRRPIGSLVTRVTNDVETLNELFTSGLVVLIFDLCKVAALLGILFWIDLHLALVVLGLSPILIAISMAFRGGARDAHRLVRARLSRLNGYLQEVLSGIRVVQLFQREERVAKRFDALLESHLAANLRAVLLFALFFPAIAFTVSLIQGSALWVGGVAIGETRLSYGEFLQFWLYLALLVSPIRELGERYNVLQSAFASAERVFQILDTEPALARRAASPPPRPQGTHVAFEGVRFSYREGEEVLKGIDLEIPRGKTVALVGATGSGKSTLVSLLLRFYEPSAGRIRFGGVDLRELDPQDLRSRLGLVLQEDFLFVGSVRENLVLGRPWVSEASLARALEASRAIDLVERLPQGLDTPVVERGATFSTGERQLLAIARALAGDPELVVLDEATASVDSATEARIEAATEHLLAGRSALVIAHRLSTVRRADQILVMHHGLVRERGTHEELLALGGLYARLYELQFRAAEG